MKVKRTIKKVTSTQKIPMDREVVKYMGEFFGRSIINNTPEEDDKKLTYAIQQNDRIRLEYEFNKETIGKIKTQLGIHDQDTQLNVGRLASKMWMSLIVLAYEQGQSDNKIKGRFKYSDIVHLWGASEGSKLYSDIRNLFISLSSATFIQKVQEGERTKVNFYSLITSGEIVEKKGEDEAATFSFTLNEDALGLTADWIRWGRLSKSRQTEGYLSIPVSDLGDSGKNIGYLNFRERLRLFGGGDVRGNVILREWMKLGDDKLRRRGVCAQLLDRCLKQAKAEKELSDYRAQLPLTKDWEQQWRVNISK